MTVQQVNDQDDLAFKRRTVFDVSLFGLSPHIQLLAVCLIVSSKPIVVECNSLLRRDDSLDGSHRTSTARARCSDSFTQTRISQYARILLLEAAELVMNGLERMRLEEPAPMATGGIGCPCEASLRLIKCALRFAFE